jgi:hypothetical protein
VTKLVDLIKKLQGKVPDITSHIAHSEIVDAMSTSPMGSELSPEERLGQMGLWQKLIDNLTKQAALIPKVLPKLPKGKLKKGLKATLATLNDITGGDGSILAAQVGLDQLLEGAPEGMNTQNYEEMLSLSNQLLKESNLRYAVSQAQYKVLADVPYAGAFARGGVVPGSGPMLATVHGGERITPAGQADVRVVIQDQRTRVWVNDQEVRAIVKDETRKQARGTPRAGARGH